MNRPEIFDRVREAFDRGRWVMLTNSDGAPQEITIDLKERPDDLLDDVRDIEEVSMEFQFTLAPGLAEKLARRRLEEALELNGHDDHGPAVPAQGDPVPAPGTYERSQIKVYEFTLQDAAEYDGVVPSQLADVSMSHAPDYPAAVTADWVHVYDRVTRERRTLKRPPADAVLTGLADVAADLRERPVAQAARGHGKSDMVFDLCAPPARPAPGPLTSTDGLLPGDVLRCLEEDEAFTDFSEGDLVHLVATEGPRHVRFYDRTHDLRYIDVKRLAFVGRPDESGWMDWPGGENPVGDHVVDLVWRDGQTSRAEKATTWIEGLSDCWKHNTSDQGLHIVRFRLVDMPPLTGDA